MIGWSDAAKYARSVFYARFNDVDIFVEDTANESRKVYVELLNRVLGKKLSVTQIFPIGSKPTVVKRCASDQGVRARPAIYIIDGDYDSALQMPMPPLIRLYRLDAYCIENYLLDPAAIVDVISDETVEHDEVRIAQDLDLLGWLNHVASPMTKLLTALIAAYRCQCGLPTVKFDLNRIQGLHRDHVDPAKVDSLVAEYAAKIDLKFGVDAYRSLAASVRPRGVSDEVFFTRHCSGKYVLMPLLRSRIARKSPTAIEYPNFRVKLARRCDVSELSGIAAAVA